MDNEVKVVNEKFTQENTYVTRDNGEFGVDTYHVRKARGNEWIATINFQHGPIKDAGEINGIFNEDLLLMIIDRLEHWQNTKFACPENAEALKHLYETVKVLRFRTERRRAEGTLGTHKVVKEEDETGIYSRIEELAKRIKSPAQFFEGALFPVQVIDPYVEAWKAEMEYLKTIVGYTDETNNDNINKSDKNSDVGYTEEETDLNVIMK